MKSIAESSGDPDADVTLCLLQGCHEYILHDFHYWEIGLYLNASAMHLRLVFVITHTLKSSS